MNNPSILFPEPDSSFTAPPIIYGLAPSQGLLEISLNGAVVGGVAAAVDGGWRFRLPQDLPPGAYTVCACLVCFGSASRCCGCVSFMLEGEQLE